MKWPKKAPSIDRAETTEIEPPYRQGRGVLLRIAPQRALVLGRWGSPDPEAGEAMLKRLEGEPLGDIEDLGPDLFDLDNRNIADE